MASLSTIKELVNSYKSWVIANPTIVTEVETLTKWASYLVAGKINKSPVVSELIYSVSNLFVLYNDTLMKSRPVYGQNQRKDSLKYWMTVLHFTEVFVEMTARSKFGIRGKWSAATLLQLIKCIANFILIYHYKEMPVQHPPMPALHRKKFSETNEHEEREGFKLKRSGRVVRRVEDSPLTQLRDWKPLNADNYMEEGNTGANVKTQRLAESLYVLKPLLHLGSMACFGSESWKQWLFALGIDLTSFKLYDDELKTLNYEQRVEISRRKLCLLYYLLRSPMYNKYSRSIINKFLTSTAKNVPLAGLICNPILQYISLWQDTYFYIWAD